MTNIIDTFLEINLFNEEDFLKIKETLTRIGIASKKDNKLFQSCHILHKQGKYYIVHFKQLFSLDGKLTDFDIDDEARRNTIAILLEEWNLLKIVDKHMYEVNKAPISQIKILSHKEKKDWELVTKYTIGKKR
jgi:hypothetical protein